jgi:hypothetical protein
VAGQALSSLADFPELLISESVIFQSDGQKGKEGRQSMLAVTDSASTQLSAVLNSDQAKGKQLIIFFQGYG